MKKVVLMALVALMSLALIVPVLADVGDVTPINAPNGNPGEKVLHVSYDEVKPGIVCGGDAEKIVYPTVAAGTTEAVLWGWAACTETISGFSYAVNGGAVTKVDIFPTEDAVKDAGAGVNGVVDTARFELKVPVTEGTQVIRGYVEFEDGSHELFWACELTVGTETTPDDAGDTYSEGTAPEPGDDNNEPGDDNNEPGDTTEPGDDNNTPGDDNKPGNTNTADSFSVIFMIAAAAMVVTVVMKKRVNA